MSLKSSRATELQIESIDYRWYLHFYTSFLRAVHEENLKLSFKTLDSCHFTCVFHVFHGRTHLRSLSRTQWEATKGFDLSCLKRQLRTQGSRVFDCQLQVSKRPSLLQMNVNALVINSYDGHSFCWTSFTGQIHSFPRIFLERNVIDRPNLFSWKSFWLWMTADNSRKLLQHRKLLDISRTFSKKITISGRFSKKK